MFDLDEVTLKAYEPNEIRIGKYVNEYKWDIIYIRISDQTRIELRPESARLLATMLKAKAEELERLK